MADTLTRRSPLQGWASRFAELPESASITEEPFVAMVDLWVDPSGPGGAAAADVLGVDALPDHPVDGGHGPDTTVIWFGPRGMAGHLPRSQPARHSRRSCARRSPSTAARRSTCPRNAPRCGCAAPMPATSWPRGAHWTCIPTVFGAGAAAQTMLGQAAVVLIAVERQRNRLPDPRPVVVRRLPGRLADRRRRGVRRRLARDDDSDAPRPRRGTGSCAASPTGALVCGIVNVTPDSFSDGGRWESTARAVEHGCSPHWSGLPASGIR